MSIEPYRKPFDIEKRKSFRIDVRGRESAITLRTESRTYKGMLCELSSGGFLVEFEASADLNEEFAELTIEQERVLVRICHQRELDGKRLIGLQRLEQIGKGAITKPKRAKRKRFKQPRVVASTGSDNTLLVMLAYTAVAFALFGLFRKQPDLLAGLMNPQANPTQSKHEETVSHQIGRALVNLVGGNREQHHSHSADSNRDRRGDSTREGSGRGADLVNNRSETGAESEVEDEEVDDRGK